MTGYAGALDGEEWLTAKAGPPSDWGDWVEDYHHCAGEYACDVGGPRLCGWELGFEKVYAARNAGRISRPKPPPTPRESLSAALSEAKTQDALGEAASWESLDGLDLMGLLAVVAECREQKRLADIVRKAATERIVGLLDGGSVSDGRVLYRVAPKMERKVKDGTELIQWLGPEDAAKVLNLDAAVSIERFRQLVTSRTGGAVTRDSELAEYEDHFFTVSRGEPSLSEMPLDNPRTPKYAKAMTPGVVRK